MRLLTKIKKLERDRAAAAAEADARSVERMPVGVLWDCDAAKLASEDLDALVDGEEVVRDFWILGSGGEATTEVRSCERVTREAADRGRVFDARGRVIGRVVEDDGSDVVVLDYDRSVTLGGAA